MGAMNKPLFEENRIPLHERIPLATPMSVTIDASSICNLKCTYCAQALGSDFDSVHFKRQLMSYETFEKIADQLGMFPQKIKKVHLFRNGESLCNPALPDMVRLLKDRGICESINISTNAVLLNEKMALDLVDAGLDTLSVSLQGMNDRQYQNIGQAKVDFNELVKRIRFFYENRGNCKLFVKNIDIALEPGDEARFYELFSGMADRVYIETACPVYGSIDYSQILKKEHVTRYGEEVAEPDICQLAFYYLHILANGDVVPCSSIDSPMPLWNIESKTLLEIWNSRERWDFLKLQALKQRRCNKVCSDCHRLSQELRPEDTLDPYGDMILKRLEENGYE